MIDEEKGTFYIKINTQIESVSNKFIVSFNYLYLDFGELILTLENNETVKLNGPRIENDFILEHQNYLGNCIAEGNFFQRSIIIVMHYSTIPNLLLMR